SVAVTLALCGLMGCYPSASPPGVPSGSSETAPPVPIAGAGPVSRASPTTEEPQPSPTPIVGREAWLEFGRAFSRLDGPARDLALGCALLIADRRPSLAGLRLDWDSRYLGFRDAFSRLPVPESADGQAIAEELGAAVGSLNALKEGAEAMEVRPSPTVGPRSPTGLQLPEAPAE